MAVRRSLPFVVVAGVAATLATTVIPAVAAETHPVTAPTRLTLPAPTGPDQIGTVSLHLVQNGRDDPYVPGRPRELMVSLTYPARHAGRYPTAPYMTPGAWVSFEHNSGIPEGSVVMPPTAAHDGAPVDRRVGGLPVILYSPGGGDDRTSNTALVQNLASRGYLVVTIDHTYLDGEVEFPDGRVAHLVETTRPTPQQITDDILARATDTRFVLDELTAIDRGQNPDVDHHRLPQGLRGALNLNRVAMFGHSFGGSTTLEAMHEDPRINAGISLDGSPIGPVITTGLNRPFLMMDSEVKGGARRDDEFWAASTGWKRDFQLLGSGHLTYSDDEYILTRAAPVMGLPPDLLHFYDGTIDPARAFTVESTYLDAFLDLHLRHHAEPVLDGPSPRFPEMVFRP